MSTSTAQFIKSVDPRAMPRYSIGEAARYLRLPPSTLRAWFEGTTYGSRPFLKHFKPILKPASKDYLSFYDVASAHVLMAFKAKEGALSPTLKNPAASKNCAERRGISTAPRIIGRRFMRTSMRRCGRVT